MAKNTNETDKNVDKRVWTCTVCGGHYLIMPVIVGQEYSVENDNGQEFWGDITDDDSNSIFIEKKDQTHAFCKTCQKETLCELRTFEPSKIPGPNLLKDVENVNDVNIKNAGPIPDDAIVK